MTNEEREELNRIRGIRNPKPIIEEPAIEKPTVLLVNVLGRRIEIKIFKIKKN